MANYSFRILWEGAKNSIPNMGKNIASSINLIQTILSNDHSQVFKRLAKDMVNKAP